MNNTGAGNGGFYTGSYDTVGVSGQCEGTLTNQDCVACLQSASDQAMLECGDSISGQIYLYKCFIDYNNKANGNASDGGSRSSKAGKIIAIILLSMLCWLFVSSAVSKGISFNISSLDSEILTIFVT